MGRMSIGGAMTVRVVVQGSVEGGLEVVVARLEGSATSRTEVGRHWEGQRAKGKEYRWK